MATLYRKYRPQKFQETVGQNPIKITLENQVQTDNFAHAYLFCGPRAVGKTTLARVLAKAINCLNRKEGESEPCNECESCQEINQGRSLDILEIDAASHTGVDNVRENIIATSRVAPSNRKYKVFIIDEVHMLSISAFNALLKVLEEPPTNVVFILCTTEVHKMPATIISRCQRFDFRPISVKDISEKLEYIVNQEGIKVDKSVLEAVARHADGHMRDAESLLGQIVAVSGQEITQKEADLVIPRNDIQEILNLIECLVNKDASSGIALVNKLVDNGIDLKAFVNDLVEILRKIMISKVNPGLSERIGLELGENLEMKLNQLSEQLDLSRLTQMLEKFLSVRNALKTSFIIQLPVELALVELSQENKGGSNSVPPNPQARPDSSVAPQAQVRQESPAPKEQPEQGASPAASSAQAVDKQEVCSRWHEVLARVKKYNHSLSFILKVCQVREVDGNTISLAFKHKFHKDRLSEQRIRDLVEQALGEVFGKKLAVESIVDENAEINKTSTPENASEQTEEGQNREQKSGNNNSGEDENFIDNILKTFGGKVIK